MGKKQADARSRQKSPATAKAVTKAPTSPAAASSVEESRDIGKAKPQRVTLSEAARLVELELVLLSRWARSGNPGSAQQGIERIRQLLAVVIEPMQGIAGDRFAALGGPGDTLSICGRCYPTAHHAAFGEAEWLLKWLCVSLETEAYDAAQAAALVTPMTPASAAAFDELHARDNGTALSPSSVTDQWEKASAIIRELLTDSWLADFRTVGARLERERAAMKSASPAASSEREAGVAAVPVVEEKSGMAKASKAAGAPAARKVKGTPGAKRKPRVEERRARGKVLEAEGKSIDEIVVQLKAEGWPEATPTIFKSDRRRR